MEIKDIIRLKEMEINSLQKLMGQVRVPYRMFGFRKELYLYTFQFHPISSANVVYIRSN